MSKVEWAGITYSQLTEPQKNFLRKVIENPESSYLLLGCPGSGKTVLAAHASKMLNGGGINKNVKLIVYTKLLYRFIKDGFSNISNNIDNVELIKSWRPDVNNSLDIAIVDEGQDFKSSWIKKVETFSDNQIWLGDSSQQIYGDAKDDGGFLQKAKQFSNSDTTELKTNYRNSLSIAQLAKNFIILNEHDRSKGITLQEKIDDFIKPIARNELQTSDARNEPNLFIEASDEEDEMDEVAKIVKEIQMKKTPNKQIAITHLRHSQLDIIQKKLQDRGVSFTRIPHYNDRNISDLPHFDKKNLTILSPIHSLKGLEFDYIIFPRTETGKIGFWESKEINNNIMFTLFTRAKNRVYCSYVNKERSYVYNAIKDDLDNQYYRFVSTEEIVEKTEKVPDNEDQEADEIMKTYFKEMEV